MILGITKIAEMAGALRVVFGCEDQLIDEVVTVLAWGDVNRQHAMATTIGNLTHSIGHMDRSTLGFDPDMQIEPETGCSHRAHAVARMLLALYCEVGR